MEKRIILSIVILASFVMVGQDITGQWNGVIKLPGKQFRVVFNISKTEKGYSSTMDSPDQGAKGIPFTTTSFENSTLKLEIPSAQIIYEGMLNSDNNIVGDFVQRGQSFPLNMSREKIEKKVEVRSQAPKKT